MANPKLLTSTDLRMQFRGETDNFLMITAIPPNELKYLQSLEQQLLEYQNAELVIAAANIEANTITRKEIEESDG
jgi:hypothetical protein